MNPFTYRNGELHVEALALARLAQDVGTPAYVYSSAALRANYLAYSQAFADQPASICYALKANSNLAVIRTFGALGAGADVVSEGEMRRALAAGIAPEKIVFSGVGKTRSEMRSALLAGIHQINVESVVELEALSAVASDLGVTAPIAVRVNPDVDAGTHAKITTGRKGNKFGIDIDQAPAVFRRAAELPGIDPRCVAVHIGSQLTDIAPFRSAFERLAELVRALRSDGHRIDRIDLGGGIGIVYRDETPPRMDDYARMVKEVIGPLGCAITLEPGRALVGNAGILLSRVIYVKPGHDRDFLILDAAMNDLIRPSFYEAYHAILPVDEPSSGTQLSSYDVVGPICESGDTFARGRQLPRSLRDGDLVAFMSAGAYGAVMSSTYNTRPLVPEVLVSGGEFAVIRRRQTVDELIQTESIPSWIKDETPSQAPPQAARSAAA